MIRTGILAGICVVAAFFCAVGTAKADLYWVIVQGKVTMEDGSPPPFIVSIERVCSDVMGNAPGPLTNKKGEWSWRVDVDDFASRYCVFKASHPGYGSNSLDASNLNVISHDTVLKLPPLVLVGATTDPYAIRVSGDDIPGRAKGLFDKAMKAADAHKYEDAVSQLQAAVAAVPKFAMGWHALGVVNDKMTGNAPAAKDAYTHAIEADPKMLQSYAALARLCIRTDDWQCAANTSDSLIKADTKHTFPEIYLHQAVAKYELKDLPGAEQSVQEFLRLDPKHRNPRAEYVLGRILEAKGDTNGAREHISKYLELQPTAPDAEQVQGHLLALGKPEAAQLAPVLEPL